MKKQRILIVDDLKNMNNILKRILSTEGYIVDDAPNGKVALEKLGENQYDALFTDWLMPEMNGVQLIQNVRNNFAKQPLIIMITVMESLQAEEDVLGVGADYYLAKPLDLRSMLKCLNEGFSRIRQNYSKVELASPTNEKDNIPPFTAVVLASSTAGCEALKEVFNGFPICNATFFIAQHGPKWMHEKLVQSIQKNTELNVMLAVDSDIIQPGCIYIAPGDFHLCIQSEPLSLKLTDGLKENFVRPSADPLFRTTARVFGRFTIGVVLTGLGMDGTYGAAHIDANGGIVLAQDPKTAVAPTMPESIISSGLAHQVVSLKDMRESLLLEVKKLSRQLGQLRRMN